MSDTTRRLSNTQKDSSGSFQLILPKEWCVANNLKHQDEVELQIDRVAPHTILIQLPGEEFKTHVSELVINDRELKSGQARRRAVLGGYLQGYETIKLINVSRKSQQRLKIRKDLQELTFKLDGCSINEEQSIFELTVASGLQSPIDLLEKLYSTTKLMFKDVFVAYTTHDLILAKDLIERDDQADKLYFSIVRNLRLILREPFRLSGRDFQLVDTLDYRMLASNLENLCDSVEVVAEALRGEEDHEHISSSDIDQLTKKEKQRIEVIGQELADAFHTAYNYYKTDDEEAAVIMSAKRPEMEKYSEELMEIGVHTSLLEVVDEAKDTIVDLLELVHSNPEQKE